MNFIFISPNFPKTYWNFCRCLKQNGVRVLGIGDAPYELLEENLKQNLQEYYKVSSLENYEEVYKACAFFAFRYGKIDWIESNNEYWLMQDAQLRTDFNVISGVRNEAISFIKYKSQMKALYEKAGVRTLASGVTAGSGTGVCRADGLSGRRQAGQRRRRQRDLQAGK